MDTVSMLNNMRFYCQPILPLVYDESMSYYETLCKVVGQLNITGETVNKLNEGLTGEIADRQTADAELDERLKLIEEENKRIHFLVFVGANPNSSMPTRTELWNWVRNGDIICALYSANDTERGDVYAASCTYNAGNWETENSSDFHFLIPLETTYDSTGTLAVKQKIVKLTIPSYTKHVLTVPWGEEIIEINTPHTSAEGIVNFSATVDNNNTVHANLSPAEFTSLYRTVSKGSGGLIVGINAQLTTNDSQLLLSTSADIVGGETAADDEVRIVFDAETYTGERGSDLPYLTRPIYILAGSGTDETWTLTKFQTRDFAFDRDDGFQFTRAANNVITPSFGSTPKEVSEYFGTVKGGVPYQNLPVRLIDTVDNAEYWNGVFDIKDNKHMTFTFVTSNYATASGKMAVRVIELSADVNTTTWKYAEKEFTLPLDVSNGVVTYTASNVGEGVYSATKHKIEYQVDFAEGVPAIIASIEAGKRVILMVDLNELGSELGSTPIYFASGYTRVDLFPNAISYIFSASIHNWRYTLELNSGLTHATITDYGELLPVPNPDGSDNGKVPTVENNKWGLKTPSGGSGCTVTAEKAFAASVLELNHVEDNQYIAQHDSVLFEATEDTTLSVGSDNLIGSPYSGRVNDTVNPTVAYTEIENGYALDYAVDYTGSKNFQNQRFGFATNIKIGKTYTLRFYLNEEYGGNVYLYLTNDQNSSGTLVGGGNIRNGTVSQITFTADADYAFARIATSSLPAEITKVTLCEGEVPLEYGSGSESYSLLAGEKVWLSGVRNLNCTGTGKFYESPLAITSFNGVAPSTGAVKSCATKKTWVNMGDSIWTFGASTGGIGTITDYMKELCGGTWHNIATGGTTMASRPGSYAGTYDALDFWKIADAIVAGNYTDAKAAAAELTSNFANIDNVNWSAVDYVTVAYGTNDLAFGATIDNESNLFDTNTICGALRYGIKAINSAYPNIRFKVLGVLYRNADSVPITKIVECNNALKNASAYVGAEFVDGYGINAGNSGTFLYDGTHPNANGKVRIAETLARNIHDIWYA